MVTSVGLSNVVWVLMLANWLLEGRWKDKWQRARESRLLQAFAVLFLVHVVALLWTSNLAAGLDIVENRLPLLAVPLIVLTTPPPEDNTRRFILNFYGLTVLIVTFIGLVRWLTIPDLPHREIVTYIHHSRFSLNVCMVIFLLVLSFRHTNLTTHHSPLITHHSSLITHHSPLITHHSSLITHHSSLITQILKILLILWFLFFLLLMRSYTGVAVLAVASLVAILRYRRRWQWIASWMALAGLLIVMAVMGCRSYYRLVPLASQPLQEYTANGRPYLHKQDGLIENGNYLTNYLCIEELYSEWSRRSAVPIDSTTPSGYSVESALIRYLNALGLTKDSAGVAALTDSQVDEIGRGIANPVYAHGSPFKKMLYVALFEYENYRCYRAVEGFTMLQRLELWRCASGVIAKHPLFGTGVGDLHDEMHTQFVAMDSPMLKNELFPHNEYLTLIAMFGFAGFALIAFFFLRAWHHTRKQTDNNLLSTHSLALPCTPSHSLLKTLWLVTILLSFLTENTLDSLPGVLFCTWFLAFRHDG